MRSHITWILILALLGSLCLTGCKKDRARTIPREAEKLLAVNVSSYENQELKDIYASHGFSTTKQRERYRGHLPGALSRRFEHDPRLDAVAYTVAYSWSDEQARPARELIRWLMWKLGVTGNIVDSPIYWVYAGSGPPHLRLDQKLLHWSRDFEDDLGDENTRYAFGLARIKDPPYGHCQALVVVRKAVEIEAIPKTYAEGDTLKIKGKFLIPNKYSTLHMTLEGAQNLHMAVNVNPDDEFSVEVPVPGTPGRHMVELRTQTKPRRNVRALRIPIYVNIPEPRRPDPIVLDPPPNPPNQAGWPLYVKKIFNAERKRFGLEPLELVPKVNRIAEEQAQARVKDWRKSWESTRKLFRKAGIETNHYDQDWEPFESLDALFAEQKSSAFFREELLDGRHTRMGFASAKYKDSAYKTYCGSFFFLGPEETREVRIPAQVQDLLSIPVDRYDDPKTEKLFEQATSSGWLAGRMATTLGEATNSQVVYRPSINTIALLYAMEGRLEPLAMSWLKSRLGISGTISFRRRRLVHDDEVDPHLVAAIKADIEKDEEDRQKKYELGMARVPGPGDGFWEAIIVVEKEVELIDPLPKHYKPGDEIVINGRFLGPANDPQMMMDLGAGEITSWRIDQDKDGYFGAKLVVPNRPGRHLLQILSDSIKVEDRKLFFGWHTELLIPIFVDSPDPEELNPISKNPSVNPEDSAKWPDLIVSIFNRERENHGLKPMRRNPVADAVLADTLHQAEQTWDHPTFENINRKLKQNGAGHVHAMTSRGTWNIKSKVSKALEAPWLRSVVLDERVDMVSVVVDNDEELFLVLLLSNHPYRQSGSKHMTTTAGPNAPVVAPRIGNLSTEAFKKVPGEKILDVASCYRELADIDEDKGGEIQVNLAVGKRGKVIAASMGESTVVFEDTEYCIVNAVRDWRFPEPVGGVHLGTLSFILEKRGTKHYVKLK